METLPVHDRRPPARIYLVDDHALVRHGLRELISQESDLEVCGDAADAAVALADIERFAPDLVVIDISLKGGNGIDLIKRIRPHLPNTKMLVASMHDESLYAERALHAGAHGYINKQEATETVIEAIRHVLDGQVYLSPAMTGQVLKRLAGGETVSSSPSVDRLTDRELQVFELVGQGLSTRAIAAQLHLSVKTIETYREHIKVKLGLKNAAELNRYAVQWTLENS